MVARHMQILETRKTEKAMRVSCQSRLILYAFESKLFCVHSCCLTGQKGTKVRLIVRLLAGNPVLNDFHLSTFPEIVTVLRTFFYAHPCRGPR